MAGAEAEAIAQRYGRYCSRAPGELAADLDQFVRLLLKWNRAKNLVSRETDAGLWERHVADSLQLLKYLELGDGVILDLGSGGGFPALPLAIALKGSGRHVTMVEPVGGKVSFLKTVTRELGLGARVIAARSDAVDPREVGPVDIVTSRALAPLPRLLSLAVPFWSARTRGLFHKGRESVEELAEADSLWRYDVVSHASDTSRDGVILEISGLEPR